MQAEHVGDTSWSNTHEIKTEVPWHCLFPEAPSVSAKQLHRSITIVQGLYLDGLWPSQLEDKKYQSAQLWNSNTETEV